MEIRGGAKGAVGESEGAGPAAGVSAGGPQMPGRRRAAARRQTGFESLPRFGFRGMRVGPIEVPATGGAAGT